MTRSRRAFTANPTVAIVVGFRQRLERRLECAAHHAIRYGKLNLGYTSDKLVRPVTPSSRHDDCISDQFVTAVGGVAPNLISPIQIPPIMWRPPWSMTNALSGQGA
jgi:hypothetical protein